MQFTPLPAAIVLVLIPVVLLAAVCDLRTRHIPNWVNLAGLALGFVVNTIVYGLAGLKIAGLGFLLGFALKFVFYLLHLTSAGDVKLMAAVGAMVGPADWIAVFLLTAIVGGIWALVLVLAKRRFTDTAWNVRFLLGEMKELRAPYKGSEQLDVNSPEALTMPRGPVNALGVLIFISLAPYLL